MISAETGARASGDDGTGGPQDRQDQDRADQAEMDDWDKILEELDEKPFEELDTHLSRRRT